ncbi:MAG: phosphate ABC transporter ATP-binding protein, partial [Sporomusa sp.]
PDGAAVRRMAGLVLQKPIALPFTIKENVLFGPRYYGRTDQNTLDAKVEHVLTAVGLWSEVKDKLRAPARELSGGQLQRLAIARILAVDPQILLLDEPCSSLDINSTRLIEDLILQLSKHLTVIIVTHNLNQAKRIADTTCFMQAGCLLESNKTESLFAQPKLPATQEFLAHF